METRTTIADELDIRCLPAPTVAAEARSRVEFRLSAWGLTAYAQDIRLVTSELVANACAETPYDMIRVRFVREPAAVVLGVWDRSDTLPQVQPVEELTLEDLDLTPEKFDDNGGRGLQLVQSLATECGVRRTEPHGKWVWARFGVQAAKS